MTKLGKGKYSVCTASPSFASMISGTQSFVYTYFKSMFPKDFFKSDYINTSLNANTLKDIKARKRSFPHIYMNTNFELGDTFMSQLPMWHKTDRFIFNNLKANYKMIFEDDTRGIRIYTVPQRYKMRFDFGIIMQTQMGAWNVVNHINQTFENGGFNYANQIRIPTQLPQIFIINICKKLNLDLNNNDDRIKLNEYLLKHGLGSILNKKNLSTGNYKFTYDYTTNILLKYPDLTNYSSQISNLINKESIVKYAIEAELWVPGSYILEIEDDFNIEKEAQSIEEDVLQFDIAILQDMIPKENDLGMKKLFEQNFITDVNVKFDVTNIDEIMDSSTMNLMKECSRLNANISKIVDFKLFKNNKEVSNSEYFINYDNFELVVKEPDENNMFTLVMYADMIKINLINEFLIHKQYNEISKMDIF